jgi:hypothetical protein
MMSPSTHNPVRGENPVNHGMAVLLEVEALLTNRDLDQHGRPTPVHPGAGPRGLTLPTATPVRLRVNPAAETFVALARRQAGS